MINVLYDMQLPGHGHHFSGVRAGLYRYAEEIALQLAESPDCEVEFFAGSNYAWAKTYLAAQERLKHCSFAAPPLKTRLYELPEAVNSFWRPASRIARKSVASFQEKEDESFPALTLAAMQAADIVHSPYNTWPCETRQVKKLVRFITIHDIIPLIHPEFYEPPTIQTIKNIVRGVGERDFVIADSQSTKNDLCNYSRISPENIFVTHLAADRSLFYPCCDGNTPSVLTKYGIPDSPYILSLSTLEPRKNIEHVIRSFVHLAETQKVNDLCLVLAGIRGWKYEGIFDEIQGAKQLKDRIIVTGFVDDTDLAHLYSSAMAFVYMSFYEGFGIPPLEAMQCGVPVITTANSSLPEVVGDAGIMLSPRDRDGLAQNLWQLYTDSSLRAAYAAKSLQRSQHFSWAQCGKETIASYQAALDRQ